MDNNNQLLKLFLFLTLKEHSAQGFTLIELLIAIFISSIVLTVANNAFVNLLISEQNIESKLVRSAGLNRALAYIQNDIKSAKSVTKEATGSNCVSTAISSANCLVLTYPASFNPLLNSSCTSTTIEPKVYYGYQDISSGNQTWLKPGVLKRKIFCSDSGGIVNTNWEVIADGLLSVNEVDPAPSCNFELPTWLGDTTVYGGNSSNKGGFRFCLNDTTTNNRLVRIFLYGHIVGGSAVNQISVNTVVFARTQ
jgi:prepilin-type N-terminal cleavage/methylation domain-containing protein